MIQLQILTGKMAGVMWTARHFPVRIGRSVENELPMDAPGVWDRHLTIGFDPASGFSLRPELDALVTVNQQPVQSHVLRAGDSIEFGSVRLRFWIAEPTRRRLRWPELAAWSLIGSVIWIEIWMLCHLLN